MKQIGEKMYDVSQELEKTFGDEGSLKRSAAIKQAWEEYNAQMLYDARKQAGLTQQQVAERIGADKGYISRVERGLIVPNVDTLYRLVSAMGYKIELKQA
jgi:ribosome-binding protein aMBF1 (putative translation factor)